MQQTRLHARVGLNLKRAVIRPGDVQSRGNSHNAGGAIGLALIPFSFIFCGIPCVGYFTPVGVQRNAGIVSLGRSHHSPTPILIDNGNPISGHIDQSGGLGRQRRPRLPSSGKLRRSSASRYSHAEKANYSSQKSPPEVAQGWIVHPLPPAVPELFVFCFGFSVSFVLSFVFFS